MFEMIADSEQTIKHFLKDNTPFINEMIFQKVLKNKDIKVNGKRIKENVQINCGDTIQVFFDFEKYLKTVVKTIYEDQNIVIVDKPQGIETTSENKNKYTLEMYLNYLNVCIMPVHRLDLNTKGLIVFAKNETAYNELIEALKNRYMTKTYNAVVHSKNDIQICDFNDYLIEDKINKLSKITDKTTEKSAKLSIKKVDKINDDLLLLKIELITGRMHQIRAQLAHHKIFVLGDGKYGDKQINKKYKIDKQVLKAVSIKFNLPNSFKLAYLNNLHLKTTFDFEIKE